MWPAGTEDAEDLEETLEVQIASAKNDPRFQDGPISGEPSDKSGPCIGSRQAVNVTGPLNANCSSLTNNSVSEQCTVPAVCPVNAVSGCTPGNVGEYARYGAPQVAAHFMNQPGPFPMVDPRHHTFSCVDARGQEPMLGTAGGDLAEVMAASMALMKLKNTAFNADMAKTVFNWFVNLVATEKRPLYLHTDDSKLRKMFITLGSNGPMPSIMPWKAPVDINHWLEELVLPQYNGCGHVRLMLQPTTTQYYSVVPGSPANTAAPCDPATTANCISSKDVATAILEEFYRFWWPTPAGSWQRRRTAFLVDNILQGPLVGKAVTIIKNAPESTGKCGKYAPLVYPSFGASQVFVYHGDAVAQWREYVATQVLAKELQQQGVSSSDFLAAWNAIAGQQLGATLTYLPPANQVGQFQVQVPVAKGSYKKASKGDGYYKTQAATSAASSEQGY